MKRLILFFWLLFIFSISYCQVKTLKTSQIKLEYPKSWKRAYGISEKLNYIIPKEIYKKNKSRSVFVLIPGIYSKFNTNKNQIIKSLTDRAQYLYPHERDKTFTISELDIENKYMFKIEYEFYFQGNNKKFKKVEFVGYHQNKLSYYTYQAPNDLFNKYYNDAVLIINSIERR